MSAQFYPSDAHREAASILDRLEFADALVRRIGPERVSTVTSSPVGIDLHPTSKDDGHAIAVTLIAAGATVGWVHSDPAGPDHPGFTSYEMTVEGCEVHVFASYRAAGLAVAS